MPESYDSSLSFLGSLGIPVSDIQEYCKHQYIEWHKSRVKKLLSHKYFTEDCNKIVIFPEGSIPVSGLTMLYDFTKAKGATVVAGSHTILETIEARKIYSELGKEDPLGKRHTYNKDVTFIFSNDKIHHQKKQGVSPFDRTDITSLGHSKVTIHPIPICDSEFKLRMVSLVCADALQLPNIKGDYDIVSIVSYDSEPKHFDSFIQTQVENNKIVLYCNDGRFGGSGIFLPLDKRPSNWFFNGPFYGHLPTGDAILMLEIPNEILPPQVGINNPQSQMSVKFLSSITYSHSKIEEHIVSKELKEISNIQDNNSRRERLKIIKQQHKYSVIQEVKLDHLLDLALKGVDSIKVWESYGDEIILDQIGLVDLESMFCKNCSEKLVEQFVERDLDPRTASSLQSYLRKCRTKIIRDDTLGNLVGLKKAESKDVYINREEEISRILRFIDSDKEFLLEVNGLPQIGKSATIGMSLDRTGFEKIKKISLLKGSSAEYIINDLMGTKDKLTLEFFSDPSFENELNNAVNNWEVIWLENVQHLSISGGWNSNEIERIIKSFIKTALDERKKTKFIFESIKTLPFNLHDPSDLFKIRICGFERDRIKHGVAIFDRQMRRMNLNPSDILSETKEGLVKNLGGHPLAVIFCVDAIYDDGLTSVQKAIRKGAGFYREVTDRILGVVNLSEEDKQILRMLSACRIEVPRDVIAGSCNFPANEYITNLIRQCLIEIVSSSAIRIPGILRKRFRFQDLEKGIRETFQNIATQTYTQLSNQYPSRLEYAIEAEYHAIALGEKPKVVTGLIDGKIAAVYKFYDEQNFKKAKYILDSMIIGMAHLPNDLIRLSTLVDAQCGDMDSALEKAEKLLSINPNDNHLFFILGKAALTQSRPEIGDRLVWIGRKAGVKETKVSLFEGRIALRRRDFLKAKDCFRQSALSTNPDPWAYYYLGITFMKMGDFQSAIEILYEGEEYLSAKPHIRGAVRNAIRTKLGVSYVVNGDLDAAARILDNCLKTDPNHPETLYAYWLLKVKKDGVEKASEAFDVFKNAKPNKWELGQYHLYYGLFLKATNRLDDAHEQFELAHQFENSNVYIMIQLAEILYILGLKQRKQGDMEFAKMKAIRCAKILRRIFEFDPDNPYAENIQIDLWHEFNIELSKIDE